MNNFSNRVSKDNEGSFTSKTSKDNEGSFTNRVSKDNYYLNIAKEVSKRSTCLKRHYGAVIVKDDEIIATGYNGSPRGETNCCDVGNCKRMNIKHNSGDYSDCHSVHAEQNAMLSASRKEMIGATLYLIGEDFTNDEIIEVRDAKPCPICERMIKNAGITRIVNRKNSTPRSIEDIFEAHKNKEFLTKDEYLYVICSFNPNCDGPSVLTSILNRYEEYIKNIDKKC